MVLKNISFIGPDYRLHHQDIQISENTISHIDDLVEPGQGEVLFDCSGLIVMPALADSHVHSPDTILKGLFTGMPMQSWCDDSSQGRLQQRLFDYLDASVGSEDFETLVLYAYIQYIRQGIGFIVETGQADDSSAVLQQCAKRIGLRALVDWYDQIPPPSDCQRIATGLHLPEEEDLTERLLTETAALYSSDPSRSMMTHCLENAWRAEACERKFGMSTVQLMAKHHLLDCNSLLFHCIHLTERDIALLATSGATAVCCPVSTMRAQEGIMPIGKMLEHRVNLTLGTDFLDHDIWDNMRFLYTWLANACPEHDGATLVYDMVSRNAHAHGAAAGYHGTIAVGNNADLCFLDHFPLLEPLVDVPGISTLLHNLITTGHGSLVRHLMVDGRFILQDRVCTTIDEPEIHRQYTRIRTSLFA